MAMKRVLFTQKGLSLARRQQQRTFIPAAYNLAKKIMPKISKTEDAALQAGTVGFDGEIFNGNPSLKGLVSKYDIKLTADEQSFMDNQVEKLCAMLDDYQVTRDRDMPEHVWEFLKQEKVCVCRWITKSPISRIPLCSPLSTCSPILSSSSA